MFNILKPINSQLLYVFCLSAPLVSWAGSDDDYLKMLEAEAESSMTKPDSNESRAPISEAESKSALIVEKKELITGMADFEKALKSEYPESYEMYSQFNQEQKKTVYHSFTKRKRLSNSTLKIISIHLTTN